MFQIGKHGLLSSASLNTSVGGNLVIPSQKRAFHNDGHIFGINGQNSTLIQYWQAIDVDASGNLFGFSNSSSIQEVVKFTPTGISWSRGLSGFSISNIKYESAVDEVFVCGTDDASADTVIVRLSGSTGAIVSQYKWRHGVSGNYAYNIETNSTNYYKGFNGYNSSTSTYFGAIGSYTHSHSLNWEVYRQDPVSGNPCYSQSVGLDGTNVLWAAQKTSGTSYCDIYKYNSAGTQQWVFSIANVSSSTGQRLVADSSSNVYMANYINDATTNANKGFMVVKLNSSGTLQWKVKYDNGDSNAPWYVRSMVIDSSGFLYVVGFTPNNASAANAIKKSFRYNASDNSTFLVKINPSDGSIVWQKYIAGAANSTIAGTKSKVTSTHLWVAGYSLNTGWVAAIPLDGKVSRTDKTVITHARTGREFSLYIGDENLTASASTTGTSTSAQLQSASTPSSSATTPSYTNNSQSTGSISGAVRI